jgi:hypothetical protein
MSDWSDLSNFSQGSASLNWVRFFHSFLNQDNKYGAAAANPILNASGLVCEETLVTA